jgi:hypothetical protein
VIKSRIDFIGDNIKSQLMMFRIVFWDVLPCKIIVDRRFRGTYCLYLP